MSTADFDPNKILDFWKKHGTFAKTLAQGGKEYTFYDGPPFATGLPHYGHIVASVIKDVIPRFMTQNGYHVPRRFGWDTHGLPIEFEVERELGIKTAEQVKEYGIANYNEKCRSIVLRYTAEWRDCIEKLGRWVDMDHDYKTMDPEFMTTVWGVWGKLWDRGLTYKGFKVMPFSTGCHTPLSNFEATSNYKNVSDPSLIVEFQLDTDSVRGRIGAVADGLVALVWTTTPWTLPGNALLCVGPDIEYVTVVSGTKKYILSKTAAQEHFKGVSLTTFARPPLTPDEQYCIGVCTGKDLVGLTYKPLFDTFKAPFVIVSDPYVKADSGTGFVHIAPMYGVDDSRVFNDNFKQSDTNIVDYVNDNGCITLEKYNGKNIKDANTAIIKDLKLAGQVFKNGSIVHSFPYCWRSDTPLIYKPVPAWFVNVSAIKDRMIAHNLATNWVPDNIKTGRFGNWLETAVDWCVSRNRYWGTPIPIWTNGAETICITSPDHLFQLSGIRVTDLHRHHIDQIEIPSPTGLEALRRIPEVFDCWFESGSMQFLPLAVNKGAEPERFRKPADFIAEGLDQTRGWFYTLLVLSTAINDRPAFKNVIVNGIVLASDGQKMSKSKKNYPDPNIVLEKYGADAVRLYLIGSSVTRAENLNFNEPDIYNIVKNVQIMVVNLVKYYRQMKDFHGTVGDGSRFILETAGGGFGSADITNLSDIMISDHLQTFMKNVITDTFEYKLYHITDYITHFIDVLSRWYLNLNKTRMKCNICLRKKSTGSIIHFGSVQVFLPTGAVPCDTCVALGVLHRCLNNFAVVTAPFIPFLAEWVYQTINLDNPNKKESVHLVQMDTLDGAYESGHSYGNTINDLMTVTSLVRKIRADLAIPRKMPIKKLSIYSPSLLILENLQEYLQETNAVNIELLERNDINKYATQTITLDPSRWGRQLAKDYRQVVEKLSNISPTNLPITIKLDKDYIFSEDDVIITTTPKAKTVGCSNGVIVVVDPECTPEMVARYKSNLLIRKIQDTRKEHGLVPVDNIKVLYTGTMAYEMEHVHKAIGFALERACDEISNGFFAKETFDDCELYFYKK